MPAVSKKQLIAMRIAEHNPDKLYERNKGMADMSRKQLHDFASTNEKGLPDKMKKSVHGSEPFTPAEISQGYRKVGD
jgi:hypothetical protein